MTEHALHLAQHRARPWRRCKPAGPTHSKVWRIALQANAFPRLACGDFSGTCGLAAVRQCFVQLTQFGRRAEHAVDVRRYIPFGRQPLPQLVRRITRKNHQYVGGRILHGVGQRPFNVYARSEGYQAPP
jgi:hypothetical protein